MLLFILMHKILQFLIEDITTLIRIEDLVEFINIEY